MEAAVREHCQGAEILSSQRNIGVPAYWLTIGLDPDRTDMNGVSEVTQAYQLYQLGYDEETAVLMARSNATVMYSARTRC